MLKEKLHQQAQQEYQWYQTQFVDMEDPLYWEKLARERLHLVKPFEKVYRFYYIKEDK